MNDRPPSQPSPRRLPDADASRLLERASELDVARGSSVADLRRAAVEAGISASAFDAALAEINSEASAPAPREPTVVLRRSRFRAVGLVAAAVLLMTGFYAFNRLVQPASPPAGSAPMVEEAILLRCLAPGEAAELIRPLLSLPGNTIVAAPARAPRVLTVRATAEQLQRVRAELDRLQTDGAVACTARPP